MNTWTTKYPSAPMDAAIVFGAILLTSLLGIATRPVEGLASFWPANALMLGLMIRFPRLATVHSLAAAFTGFMVADLVTGRAGPRPAC